MVYNQIYYLIFGKPQKLINHEKTITNIFIVINIC